MRYIVLCQMFGLMLGLKFAPAHAHFGELYGWGNDGIARTQSVTSSCGRRAFGAYINTSLLACERQTVFEMSFVSALVSLSHPQNIVTSSSAYPTNPDSISSTGNATLRNPNHYALQVGMAMPLWNQWEWAHRHRLSFGIAAHVNVQHLMSLDSGIPYAPHYSLFGHRDQRLFVSLGVGAMLIEDRLWFGIGTDLFVTAGATTVVLFSPNAPNAQVAADVDPQAALSLSMRMKPIESSPLFIALTVHQNADQTVQLSARTDLVIANTSTPIEFSGQTTLYSEPWRLGLGLVWEEPQWETETTIQYTFWEEMKPSSIELVFVAPAKTTVNPTRHYQNTFSVGQSLRFQLAAWDLLAGVSYAPSLMKDHTGPENEIDCDRVVVGAGIRRDIWGGRVGLAIQWQQLLEKTFTKAQNDFIGYPSYTADGRVLAASIGYESRW